ncbi:MAG: hypothetical protein ACR2IF_05015 [Terriglobales bacterium]
MKAGIVQFFCDRARVALWSAVLCWMCVAPAALQAQSSEPSLAEAAKSAHHDKPVQHRPKVYDNDNLPRDAASAESAKPASTPKEKAKEGEAKSPPDKNASPGLTPAEWRTRIVAQQRKIADLEYELQQIENGGRQVRTEFEDPATGKEKPRAMLCATACAPFANTTDADRYNRYQDYLKQREAKKADLEAARAKLKQMEDDLRRWHIEVPR